MRKHYCSTMDITRVNDITLATSFVLNGVQTLAEQEGEVLSQDEVVDRATLGTYDKEGRMYLQAVLAID